MPEAKAICDDNFVSVGERNMPFIRTGVGIKALKRNCCQMKGFVGFENYTYPRIATLAGAFSLLEICIGLEKFLLLSDMLFNLNRVNNEHSSLHWTKLN